MKITDDWITADSTQRVLHMLTSAGQQAFLVGGCVRNALLGQAVADIDIATDALPATVMSLARAAGMRPVPTGVDHGTVTVLADHVAHEVTTFRRDVETFGRHATVAFSPHIEEDAARRDFTMNALYARADGRVIDPLGSGLADLAARRLRFVGKPKDRIREDYLRILRFFRFTALYGDPANGPDAEGLAACAAHADCINTLSRERVGAEMRKLLTAPDPGPALASMEACGVLAHTLAGATARAIAPLVHLEDGHKPDFIRRLAALGGTDQAEALRLSNAEARALEALQSAIGSYEDAGTLGYRLGEAGAQDALLVRAALLEMPLPEGWPEAARRGASARFPISAADLMPDLQGPALGQRLRDLEARWIASGFTLSRDELLR
ncbi:CCA tRNA nucleotidyltransferase [Phaeovulum sp.]|uniref:CCA tRNA nucleotidyltransferase n=1 Tax=Phaeovulum sp. TaxID=2934796 RepID=UPI0039E2591A